MLKLFIHDDARADLEALWASSPSSAALIAALLQEIKGDPVELGNLLEHGFGDDYSGKYSVSKWQSLWKKGLDLWRLRIWKADRIGPPYRVIYSYMPSDRSFYVLGILHRDFNYDVNDPRAQRILGAYDSL